MGSNSAHVKVVDLAVGDAEGEPFRTVAAVKRPTRLAEAIMADGRIEPDAVERLVSAVSEAVAVAAAEGAVEVIAFATSAVRDAANRCVIVDAVTDRTGLALGFLSGRDEACLTFLAVRAWYGWSAGPLLLADIGGGSLELAVGAGAQPEAALSLPLGAGRLTRSFLPDDPPRRKYVKRLRRHVAAELAEGLTVHGSADLDEGTDLDGRPVLFRQRGLEAVATSKTFTQLARLTRGKARDGSRGLRRKALRKQIPRLAKLTARQRAELKGVSTPRARQILAGAIVAHEVMAALELKQVRICPWALREGIALRRLQQLAATPAPGPVATVSAAEGTGDIDHLVQPLPVAVPGRRLHALSRSGA